MNFGSIFEFGLPSIFIISVTLVAAIVIILENKNPHKTIAWLLTIILLPVLGIILYAFFGQTFRHRRQFRRKRKSKEILPDSFSIIKTENLTLGSFRKTALMLEKSASAMVTTHNSVAVFQNTKLFFDALIKEIESAKHHIHLEFYILEDDSIGNQIKDLLLKKAKEGVRIRIIFDSFGSKHLSTDFLSSLKNTPNISIQSFLPIRFPFLTTKANHRNHRKIVVIDGKHGFTGGINISDKYLNGDNIIGKWDDMGIHCRGEMVQKLQLIFLNDWFFVSGENVTACEYFNCKSRSKKRTIAQIIECGPDTLHRNICNGFISAINNAKNSIYISTPYFHPTEEIIKSLKIAALSGVTIKIILPRRMHSKIVTLATRSYIEELLYAGVKIFVSNNFVHSKLVIIDSFFSSIGSTNFDARSFDQNFEVNAFIYDKEVAGQTLDIWNSYLKSCDEISLENWKKRPWGEKLGESFFRIFSPLF